MLRRVFMAGLAAAALISPLAGGAAQAQVGADLNISPKRVVFDERTRSAVVYVFNQGDVAATYTVSLVDRMMLPTGEIIEVAEADGYALSASGLIQYAPRRVVLGPRESQAIRVRVRVRPPGQGQGEYRTHLTITAVPDEAAGYTVDQANADDEDLAIRIVALFSLSIPLIVREGAVDSRADIDNPTVTHGGGAVTVDLRRLGVNSVYGDLDVRAVRDGREEVVGQARGVAVYPEAASRPVHIPLSQPLVSGETLRIVWRDGAARPETETAVTRFRVP